MGKEALDWLFELGAEVWVTDMVQTEALRDPGPGTDQRRERRDALWEWFNANAGRIRISSVRLQPEPASYRRLGL